MSSNLPDLPAAVEQYRELADTYDHATRRVEPFRQRAIQRLLLRSGDRVIDTACGTGANFLLLEKYVGPRGRVLAIDASAEMLGVAQQRADRHGLRNIDLVHAPVEEARIAGDFDAALFSFTHDVLRSPTAIRNVLGSVRENGRIAATGAKWAPAWAFPVNLVVRRVARRYVTTYEGFDRPWSHLERDMRALDVETLAFGAIYVVSGAV